MSYQNPGLNPKMETSARDVLIGRMTSTTTVPTQSNTNPALSRPGGSIIVTSNFISGARRVVGDEKSKTQLTSQQSRPIMSTQNNLV